MYCEFVPTQCNSIPAIERMKAATKAKGRVSDDAIVPWEWMTLLKFNIIDNIL